MGGSAEPRRVEARREGKEGSEREERGAKTCAREDQTGSRKPATHEVSMRGPARSEAPGERGGEGSRLLVGLGRARAQPVGKRRAHSRAHAERRGILCRCSRVPRRARSRVQRSPRVFARAAACVSLAVRVGVRVCMRALGRLRVLSDAEGEENVCTDVEVEEEVSRDALKVDEVLSLSDLVDLHLKLDLLHGGRAAARGRRCP